MNSTSQKDNEPLGELPPPSNAEELVSILRDTKERAGNERKAAMDKFFAGYEILFSAVKNAALAGNVTCKLAILNLLKLHGK